VKSRTGNGTTGQLYQPDARLLVFAHAHSHVHLHA
jgi:hypothetical protein